MMDLKLHSTIFNLYNMSTQYLAKYDLNTTLITEYLTNLSVREKKHLIIFL